MIGRTETLEADLQRLLGALHWDQALLPAERDNSSVDKCKADAQCRAVVEGQLGPGALDRVTSSRELLPLMFASDASHDLVELVRARYAEDVAAGSFELPSIDNSTST